ncbi:hypothetical protein ES703_101361 [subsurface metagenome]
MALILYGSVVANIAGSIGGATFARNRYGAYIRNRTKPVDPGSNLQTEFRTRVSAAVTAWQALTATQRAAFNSKAKTTDLVNRIGQSFHPSGINLFIRTYNLLDMAGIAQVTTPPVSPITHDGSTTATYSGAYGWRLESITANWPADSKMLIWTAINKTNSTYFFKGPYDFTFKALATDYVTDVYSMHDPGDVDADSSMFAMWRLVAPDGAASHARRSRAYKAPA